MTELTSSNIATVKAQKILAVTLLVTLISVAGIALPYPVLAPLFAEANSELTQFMGLPPELLLGLVLGIYPLGIIIGSSMIGSLSDSFGRKRLLTLTLLGSAVGYGLTAVAALSEQFLLFCLARFFTGLCEGNISIARAIAADLHPTIDKTRSFSLISAMGYGGYLIGPLAGGYLVLLGIDAVFWIAAAACLFCALLSHISLPNSLDIAADNAEKQSSLALLKDAAIRRFCLLYLMLTTGVNLYYEYYPLHLVRQYQYTSVDISWVTVLLTSCMIAASILLNPKIQRRFNHAQAGLIGMLLFATALSLFAFTHSILFMATFALMGVGIAIYNGFLPSYLSTAYEQRPQGQLMGILVTIFCLGNLVAALLGGLFSMFDVRAALLFGAVISALAAALFYHGHYRANLWQQASR